MSDREKLIELIFQSLCDHMHLSCKLAENIADDLIANGVNIQKWISVTERLPQEDLPVGALCEVVQVLLNDGTVTIGWCNRGLGCWFHMPILETRTVGHDYDKSPVVAWQPLAKPPKGE